jgi:Fur family transcriptional regulator, ferric uptake regulator
MMKIQVEQKLVGKNINPTAMRILVLELLLQQNSAISLTDIEKSLETADRSTIYRTLKTFGQNGLIHIVEDGTGTPKYALCVEECSTHEHHDTHVHFYCNSCKETFCLPDHKIPNISLPSGFTSAEMNLIVKGTCEKCSD